VKWFYVRWGGVFLAAIAILVLGFRHYERELKTITPDQLLREQPSRIVRVRGMVLPGSLTRNATSSQVRFQLGGEKQNLSVQYQGETPENLRELKTLVVIGRWDPVEKVFKGNDIALVPNYGFVAAAYLGGLVPMVLFLFVMERKVALLYQEIRSLKIYEPEGETH
jgi:cytochrome c-type biogenesis protein CcmE